MRQIQNWIVGLAVVVILAWTAWTTPTLKECVQAANQNYSQQPLPGNVSDFYGLSVAYRLCLGAFLHESGESIIALFTIILGLATWFLWRATRDLVREAKLSGLAQAQKMEESVAEAARAAVAMEKLATNSETSTNAGKKLASQQLRAYLTVVFGDATYQEREKGIQFGGMPRFINTGQTPAHKLRYRARAGILPMPLPDDFVFPLPEEVTGGMVLGPHQNSDISIFIDHYVPDEEVAAIKFGSPRALYVWGIVSYIDAFDEPRETKFCQSFLWLKGPDREIPRGYYSRRHNEAT